jgi:chromosome segregation ATPase
MALLNSKKLKELQSENEELKAFIQDLTNKETHFRQFDELVRRTRVEYANITLKKDQTALTLEHLEKEKNTLISQMQKLSGEIEQLREMKVYEQNQIHKLTDNSAKQHNKNEIAIRFPVYKEIELAEKRKTELEKETAEMEKRFREVYQRVLEVGEMEQSLGVEIKKKKDELNALNGKKNEFTQEQLKNFNSKIITLKDEEKKNLLEVKQKIKQLSDRENELNTRLEIRSRELQEIEKKIEQKTFVKETDGGDKLLSLIVEEQKLLDSIDLKKKSLSELEESILYLKTEQRTIANQINRIDTASKSEKQKFKDETDASKLKSAEIIHFEKEANTIQGVIKALKEEEQKIRESIEQLAQSEELKKELISQLNDELSSKEIQFASIEKDYDTKSSRLNEISFKNKLILEELAAKTNELSIAENNLKSKTGRLSEITGELEKIERKLITAKSQLAEKDYEKSEIEDKIKVAKDTWSKLDDYYKKVKDVVPLLEKRKDEVQISNSMLEKRFADMFKHYSTQMGEMYKKKNLLEQMLIKKENDVNEKDQSLLDKLSALDEAEKILSIRKTEAESIEDLLKTINEQKELLAGDITSLENKSVEKRIQNKELSIESELYHKKLIEFENGLKELFQKSEERFNKNTEQKARLESEIREYEHRLNELNKGIKDSMEELVNLRTTINKIKVEHEDHRLAINKLAAVKKKLEDEINKHQVVIDKYTKIKEKIRQEQNLIKMKRELFVSTKSPNQSNEGEKTFEPHNPNWIKL